MFCLCDLVTRSKPRHHIRVVQMTILCSHVVSTGPMSLLRVVHVYVFNMCLCVHIVRTYVWAKARVCVSVHITFCRNKSKRKISC